MMTSTAADRSRATRLGLGTPARRFRAIAVAEALTWLALLIGMVFKHLVVKNEIGVQVFGPIHGAVFLGYVVVALLTARALRWSAVVTGWALVASVPPFGSIVFERWARRHGHLGELS